MREGAAVHERTGKEGDGGNKSEFNTSLLRNKTSAALESPRYDSWIHPFLRVPKLDPQDGRVDLTTFGQARHASKEGPKTGRRVRLSRP